jgi:nudix-type nucleoside diphosphatase (YffH/AdpP family)
MKAEIVERRIVYNRWSRVSEVLVRMPNGAIEKRMIEDHGCAAAVLLYDPDRRVALILRQPRPPVMEAGGDELLQVVAGRLDGKDGEATVRAEAWEEAGVRVRDIEPVANLWMMPAVSTERLDLYLAAYCEQDRLGEGGGAEDENECILLEEIPLRELADMAASGRLADAKTYILLQALIARRPELFR